MHTDVNTGSTTIAAVYPRWADTGAVILGGGFRLPAARDARTADKGAVVLGGGFRLPTKG